ncbi:helix-turn-helix transcriptional regulator [Clostridium sp. D53t1_180928_C8]|uniref:helix-turn-helix transcriptional regulator n=1 Tax=Clostridium sp. D53t1_180928_C8 TaxID=2787101 RepID=UPI00325FBF9A
MSIIDTSKYEFGIIVKKRLVELKMTQRQLAKNIGMNENYLTDILAGRKSGTKYRDSIIKEIDLDKK